MLCTKQVISTIMFEQVCSSSPLDKLTSHDYQDHQERWITILTYSQLLRSYQGERLEERPLTKLDNGTRDSKQDTFVLHESVPGSSIQRVNGSL